MARARKLISSLFQNLRQVNQLVSVHRRRPLKPLVRLSKVDQPHRPIKGPFRSPQPVKVVLIQSLRLLKRLVRISKLSHPHRLIKGPFRSPPPLMKVLLFPSLRPAKRAQIRWRRQPSRPSYQLRLPYLALTQLWSRLSLFRTQEEQSHRLWHSLRTAAPSRLSYQYQLL